MAKITNLEISISTDQFDLNVYVDDRNMTTLSINSTVCSGIDGGVYIPPVKVGDFIELITRSSTWWGEVVWVTEQQVFLVVDAEGVFQSVFGGLSGLLTWQLRSTRNATVETSLWDTPVPWDVYVATKTAANSVGAERDKRDAIWREILAICMRK